MSSNINPADGVVSALNTRTLSGADAAATLAQLRTLAAQANGGATVGHSEVSVAANGVHSAVRSLNTTIAALQGQIAKGSTPALQQALTQAQANLTQVKSGVAQLNNALNTAGVGARIQLGANGAQVNSVGTAGAGGLSSGSAQASPLDAPANENSNLLASGNVLDDKTLAASPGLQLLKSAVQDVLKQVLSGQLNPDGTPTGQASGASTGSGGASSATQTASSGSGVQSSNTSPAGGASTQASGSGQGSPTTQTQSSSGSGSGSAAGSAALLGGSKQDFANSLFEALFESIKKIKAQAVDNTNGRKDTKKQGGSDSLGKGDSGASGNSAGTGNVSTAGAGNTGDGASTQSAQTGDGASTQSSQTGDGASTQASQTGDGASTQTSPTGGGATTQTNLTGGGATTQGGLTGAGGTGGDNFDTKFADPVNSDAAPFSPDPLLSYPNINGLLQAILLESYSGSQKDLKAAAMALQKINTTKSGLRDQYSAAISNGEEATGAKATGIKNKLDQAGDDTQLLQISIQTATQNSSQALTTLTNFIKATNDNAQAVIHHIGGG